MKNAIQLQSAKSTTGNRRGIATIWMILLIPVFFTLFGVMIDIARVWVAQIELKTALDAAVLSGVKTWADGGNTVANRAAARDDTLVAADANTVVGLDSANPSFAVALTLDRNETLGGDANDNTSPNGEVVLGSLMSTGGGTSFTFCSNTSPGGADAFSVHARKTVAIFSIWKNLFGITVGQYNVSADSVAAYQAGEPRLVRVDVFSSACP